MDQVCTNHPDEKAVGICGRCGNPACYRCSMNVGQVVYCSLKCFNELDSPSSQQIPNRWELGKDPLSGLDLKSADSMTRSRSSTGSSGIDPLSDIYKRPLKSDEGEPSPFSPESEPSILLSAQQADEPPSDSSIMLPAHQADEPGSDASIMMSAHQADGDLSNTTILGMGSPKSPGATPKALSDETVSAMRKFSDDTVSADQPLTEETVSAIRKLQDDTVSAARRLQDETVSAERPLGDETVSATFDAEDALIFRSPSRPAESEGPMPILIPGTRRSMISSSCFFHPDTSAIVLCASCRNPICSLCAEETTAGLVCSPSCGVPDPVRQEHLRTFKVFSFVMAAAVVAVIAGGAFLFHTQRQEEAKLAATTLRRTPVPEALPGSVLPAKAERAAEPAPNAELPRPEAPKPEPAKAEPAPALIAKAEAPKPEPLPAPTKARLPKPEPPKSEPAPAPIAKVDAPKPEPLPAPPKVEHPKPESAPVVIAKVEAPKPEPPKAEPPKPDPAPVVLAKPLSPEALPPKPEAAKKESSELERDLKTAAGLLREAAPLFRELADTMDPKLLRRADVAALGLKLDALKFMLKQAEELYGRRLDEAKDRAALEKRISVLGELQEAVDDGQNRIRVPRTLLEADRLNREATTSYHELLFRLKSARPGESRQTLGRDAVQIESKFREARELYLGVKTDAPDPKGILQRIRAIDGNLEALAEKTAEFRASVK